MDGAAGDQAKTHGHALLVCSNAPLQVPWPLVGAASLSAALWRTFILFLSAWQTFMKGHPAWRLFTHLPLSCLRTFITLGIMSFGDHVHGSSYLFFFCHPYRSHLKTVRQITEINAEGVAASLVGIFILSAKDVLWRWNRKHALALGYSLQLSWSCKFIEQPAHPFGESNRKRKEGETDRQRHIDKDHHGCWAQRL